jgi:hypothetical protein
MAHRIAHAHFAPNRFGDPSGIDILLILLGTLLAALLIHSGWE